MKNIKLIIILLITIIILLGGFMVGKSFFAQDSEKQAQVEYERARKLSNEQGHDSAARIREAFKNLDKTR